MDDPHHPVSSHEAAEWVAGFLLDEYEVELAGLQSADERTALAHGEFEVDLGIQLAEVAEDLRELGEREVIR